ncbi:MAG: lytic transglycosylase [Deltaproteobacteria bacterium CG_4_8_14_3_um_filter_45_9]|nr:MAG: lytic transglycosylase [Deltaproteobacteria bacterium CG03_land_8_20_14_0_80_45_14]PIX23738.1 MAG: lytic transglycosylase [Deltaproteobacteria bacterium CG_4_8_14_3_um_filter_45_9]
MVKTIIFIFLVGFFLMGCAAGQSVQKGPEKIIVQSESPEKYEAKYDVLLEKLKALEKSISVLRSEVTDLGYRLNHIQIRPSLTTYKLPKEVFLCEERFPLEDRNVWENLDREFLLALSNEAQALLWMKRARRYFPLIEKRLKEMGLPDDLKYVTITESSLRPKAISSSGAGGIWQFIPSTGEKYGMRKNRSIDERFDFFKATEGALSYLRSLYEEFKSWTLSMAAYNAGENRVRKEIDLQKTRNYFYLDLPSETERYVYKIAVAKIILSDPGRYGYKLEEKEFYNPLQVERVQIELTQPLPIIEVARATGFFYKQIKEMNPHLFEETIPPGIHSLNLPPGTAEKFWTFFSAWKKEREGK